MAEAGVAAANGAAASPRVSRLRAGARLCLSVLHVLHGAAIVVLRFGAYPAERRVERVQWWARRTLQVMGLDLQVDGGVADGAVLLVANHVSWLDIVALHAVCPRARFVSKADVRRWPVLSSLADAADTLYLERERKRDALRVVHLMAEALRDGDAVAVFPEGTTSDGRQLLPFHANLLQAAIASGAPVQPIALRFSDPRNTYSPAVEYIGTTSLATSLWRVACGAGLTAHVSFLAAQDVAGADRRELAQALCRAIAERLPPA